MVQEKQPLQFARSMTVSLPYGDYSLRGFENEISIERKSLNDLASSLAGYRRARLERNIQKCMSMLRRYAIVVEANYADLKNPKNWNSNITPNCLIGTILKWQVKYGFQLYFAGDRNGATEIVKSLLEGYAYYNK